MAVLVGIDEAGFGPILGPMVVSSAAFSLPQNLLQADLWRILKRSVSAQRKSLSGRLLIADSKKAHNRPLGIKHLQRTTLAVFRCLGQSPTKLNQLFQLLCPDSLARLDDYPWYQTAGDLTLSADQTDVAIASAVLADDLAANNIRLLALRSCCLDVAHYNKMVAAVKNKASVLFSVTSQLIKAAFDNLDDDQVHIIIDRQGGRVHYRKQLQRSFENMRLKILRETPAASSYELNTKSRNMRLHFVVRADDRFLPVSLASMVSKYLRELLVGCMNRYFTRFNAQLRPTAGYWKDGLRFIKDLHTTIPDVRFDNNLLIRCR